MSNTLYVLGELSLMDGDFAAALRYLDKAVKVQDDLRQNFASSTWDLRGSFHTQALQANALCMAQKFTQGIRKYEDAIKLEEAHVGSLHHNLVPKYANFGICLKISGDLKEARRILGRAIEIIDANPTIPHQETRVHIMAHLREIPL